MQCTSDSCRIEWPTNTQYIAGQQRQDFPQKIENKSNKTETKYL